MASEAKLLEFVGQIYDAAADASLWPAFLENFADAVGGGQTALLYYDTEGARPDCSQLVRSNPEFHQKYAEYYCQINPWIAWANRRNRVGPESVSVSEERVPFSVLQRTEFYNDYLRPQDTVHQFGCILGKGDGWMSAFASLRGRKQEPFGPAEVQILNVLCPHLQRAVQFNQKIGQLDRRQSVLVDIFNRLSTGTILLDHRGRLIFSNCAAQRILDQKDGLSAKKDGLWASTTAQSTRLRMMVGQACRTAQREGLSAGGAIGISRPSGKRNLSVLVMPVSTEAFVSETVRPAVVVFVSDPEEHVEIREAVLAEVFCLTNAESRLAKHLTEGETLVQAADQLGVSHNTVRTHLQRVYEKTGTRHQGELIRLLLLGAARLP